MQAGVDKLASVVGVTLGFNGAGYTVQATDTLASVAAGLAAACNGSAIGASANGLVVTVSGNQTASFNIGSSWTRIREVSRRRKVFFASLHCALPYDRSIIGKVLETTYGPSTRLPMPDGSLATLVPISGLPMQSWDSDAQQRDTTWMRRVSWIFDFISTQSIPVTQIVAIQSNTTAGPLYSSGLGTPVGLDARGALDTLGFLDIPLQPPLPSQL
jgi:hypothetical protein